MTGRWHEYCEGDDNDGHRVDWKDQDTTLRFRRVTMASFVWSTGRVLPDIVERTAWRFAASSPDQLHG